MRVDIGDGTQLFFDVVGPGLQPGDERMEPRPTLLLLHGGPGMDHTTFRPSWDHLSDLAQIVVLDHRGNGRSDGWDDPSRWDLDTWADDVRRFCDALGIVRPVVCGNSFGGMVAMHYGARHPDHAGALILSSTAARLDIELIAGWFTRLGGSAAGEVARRFWSDPGPEHMAEYLRRCGPLYTQTDGNLFDDRRTIRNPELTSHFVTEIMPVMDLRPDLGRVAAPTLLLAGGLDPVCPIESMTEVADGIAEELVQFEVFWECGHGVFRDDAAGAFDVVRRFVEDQAPRLVERPPDAE